MLMHPSIPFILAGVLLPVLPFQIRRYLQLFVPAAAFWFFLKLIAHEIYAPHAFTFMGLQLSLVQIDKLAELFVIAFIIFAFLAHLYSFHKDDRMLVFASNLYAGSSLGAVLAADLVTLFIFWEIMAVTSVFLIYDRHRSSSVRSMFRYLLVHLTGGLFFFSGVAMKLMQGNISLHNTMALDTAGWLLFAGFAVNAAIVPLHAWLPDAYPQGTPEGSIYLSCFTTKTAVYILARCFPGQPVLIWLGALTALYGVIYALMEDDMRKLLSYHIVCQIGYMIAGIGIGSAVGISAGTGHAVGNILFKGLLFMATGSIIFSTGKHRLSELGGLAKVLPVVLLFYMIGTLSISGAPFFNGYLTKSLLLKAAAKAHLEWLEILLLIVAVGTFLSIGCKLAWFAFWGEKKNQPTSAAGIPFNMYLAMGLTSLLCIGIGVIPEPFYEMLPHAVHDHPFELSHLLPTLQMLVGTYLGFLILRKSLHAEAHLTLDTDWFYRKGAGLFLKAVCGSASRIQTSIQSSLSAFLPRLNQSILSLIGKQEMTSAGMPMLALAIGSLCVGIAAISRLF